MKRLLCALLILFFIPSFVFADTVADIHPAEFVGCWAVFIPQSITFGYGDQAFIVTLNSDGTMSQIIVLNKSAENDILVSSYTASWMYSSSSEAILFQVNGTDEIRKFPVSDDTLWVKVDSMRFGLKKIPDIDISRIVYDGN